MYNSSLDKTNFIFVFSLAGLFIVAFQNILIFALHRQRFSPILCGQIFHSLLCMAFDGKSSKSFG